MLINVDMRLKQVLLTLYLFIQQKRTQHSFEMLKIKNLYSRKINKMHLLQFYHVQSFYSKKNHCVGQVGHCFVDICQHSKQLSLSICCFISPLRTLVSWHSFKKTHIHLTVSTLLGIEAILCLLDVCKASENPASLAEG